MANARHGRTDSSESGSSTGSQSYHMILDHILTYPGSYEIPLRTMYTLNCASRAHTGRGHSPKSSESSPITPQGSFQDDKATQTFSDNVMAQLQQLPQQPTSLPASFITSFLKRCFPPALMEVDFPQALTGLDYLKDLEMRRRREVRNVMVRLDIDRDNCNDDALAAKSPQVAQWAKTIEEKERKIDALYTQLYIGLRRWLLINELSLLPFNKHNCVALLNTLYPPMLSDPPTTKLTMSIMKNQRDGFFKYIQSVERNGSRVLQNLMQQGKGPIDGNGWVAVTRTLGMYLQLANSMITEALDIKLENISPRKTVEPKATREPRKVGSGEYSDTKSTRQPRKVDSGVSFSLPDDTSSKTNSVIESTPPSPTDTARPKTPSGSVRTEIFRPKTPSGGKHGTTLERLARGLKTIGRSRTDVKEMISDDTPPPPPPEKAKTIRKMKSMGAFTGSKLDVSSVRNQPTLEMSADEMRRERTKFEAGIVSAQKSGGNKSHEI